MPRREKRKIFDFDPLSMSDYDHRFNAAKRIRRVYLDLKRQCNINSMAKDLMAKRAAFLAIRIETLEVELLTTKGKVIESSLLNATNQLCSILKQLGLENMEELSDGQRPLQRYKAQVAQQDRLKAEQANRKRQRLARKHNRSRPQPLALVKD